MRDYTLQPVLYPFKASEKEDLWEADFSIVFGRVSTVVEDGSGEMHRQ